MATPQTDPARASLFARYPDLRTDLAERGHTVVRVAALENPSIEFLSSICARAGTNQATARAVLRALASHFRAGHVADSANGEA